MAMMEIRTENDTEEPSATRTVEFAWFRNGDLCGREESGDTVLFAAGSFELLQVWTGKSWTPPASRRPRDGGRQGSLTRSSTPRPKGGPACECQM